MLRLMLGAYFTSRGKKHVMPTARPEYWELWENQVVICLLTYYIKNVDGTKKKTQIQKQCSTWKVYSTQVGIIF